MLRIGDDTLSGRLLQDTVRAQALAHVNVRVKLAPKTSGLIALHVTACAMCTGHKTIISFSSQTLALRTLDTTKFDPSNQVFELC